MTLPQVLEQFDYWQTSPPVHELVAAYLRYRPPAGARSTAQPGEHPTTEPPADFAAFAAMFPGGSFNPAAPDFANTE